MTLKATNSADKRRLFCDEMNKATSGITKIGSYNIIGNFTVQSHWGCCLYQNYGDDSFKGKYVYPTALVGETVTLQCMYNPSVSLTRKCEDVQSTTTGDESKSKQSGWLAPDLKMCKTKTKTTMKLGKLNVTSHCNTTGTTCTNATELSKELTKVITNTTVITSPKDIAYIADITKIISTDVNENNVVEVTNNILQTVGEVLGSKPSLIAASEFKDTSATNLLKNIESFSKTIGEAMKSSTAKTNVTISKKNVALQVAKITSPTLKILSKLNSVEGSKLSVGLEIKDSVPENDPSFLASLELTYSDLLTGTKPLVFSQAYLKSTLFVTGDQRKAIKEGTEFENPVQSVVLAVNFNIDMSNLQNPAILKFKKRFGQDRNSTCRYWQFAVGDTLGFWNDTGCLRTSAPMSPIVTCQCSHLTNFAILMDVYQTQRNDLSLQIVTWIGCAISLVGLMLTIVIFLYFKELRKKLPSKILVCVCISLTINLIIFLSAVEKAKVNRRLCQVVAGLIQYFILAAFTWMCIAAFNLYQLLVKIFPSGSKTKFFIRASIIGWGLPLIMVVITGAVGADLMGNSNFCIPQGFAAYFGLFLPICIILLINFSILVVILVKFARKAPVGDNAKRKTNYHQARLAVSISVLLGLAWVFAVFAAQEAEFIFQLLFCIFNSLQGFFIFVLYTFTNESVRKEILKVFRKKGGSASYNSSGNKSSSSGGGGKKPKQKNGGATNDKRQLRLSLSTDLSSSERNRSIDMTSEPVYHYSTPEVSRRNIYEQPNDSKDGAIALSSFSTEGDLGVDNPTFTSFSSVLQAPEIEKKDIGIENEVYVHEGEKLTPLGDSQIEREAGLDKEDSSDEDEDEDDYLSPIDGEGCPVVAEIEEPAAAVSVHTSPSSSSLESINDDYLTLADFYSHAPPAPPAADYEIAPPVLVDDVINDEPVQNNVYVNIDEEISSPVDHAVKDEEDIPSPIDNVIISEPVINESIVSAEEEIPSFIDDPYVNNIEDDKSSTDHNAVDSYVNINVEKTSSPVDEVEPIVKDLDNDNEEEEEVPSTSSQSESDETSPPTAKGGTSPQSNGSPTTKLTDFDEIMSKRKRWTDTMDLTANVLGNIGKRGSNKREPTKGQQRAGWEKLRDAVQNKDVKISEPTFV